MFPVALMVSRLSVASTQVSRSFDSMIELYRAVVSKLFIAKSQFLVFGTGESAKT